ncbi:uncharacterized protein BO88DRAFT_406134 [Aspergillus vadensis CBS 113365]|uniref:Uncharacterized protein n=2 Tax=Aspergillus subgen. Circumdati TaxID=2720871 RepID=A0A319B4C7_ASPVC|nr:hypothetical protein BO88DRAFT_406134 [Aspergillus vadensis CBS 113365]PYH67235.1 hypothetical protein BO88DRAFT_406134 [Aspergillus vadensis CBS 113365]
MIRKTKPKKAQLDQWGVAGRADLGSYRFYSRGRFARFGLHMMNITNSGWPDALHSM